MRNICDTIEYDIIQWVTEYKEVSLVDVLGKSRKRNLFIARMLISYCLLYRGVDTLETIGFKIGRDHSTVHYYKGIFIGGMDVLVNYELRMFALFLEKRGVELPDLEAFKKRMEEINDK